MVAYPVGGQPLAIFLAAFIGGPHYLATLSFYFWDDVHDYHRHEWVAHFALPAAIVTLVFAIVWLNRPSILILLVYFWNALHVARQSCGILSIYRHLAGAMTNRDRFAANASIVSTSLCMALTNTDWYPSLHRLLTMPSPELPRLMWQASLVATAASLAYLVITMALRLRRGAPPKLPELCFLLSSLVMFHPYLWIRDGDLATLVMLLGHFIQYLGIMWLLNTRKLPIETGTTAQRFVARMWHSRRWLVPAALLSGGIFLVLQLQLMAVSIALVLVHFYLDGVFWAFKRRAVREAISPYLSTSWMGHSRARNLP